MRIAEIGKRAALFTLIGLSIILLFFTAVGVARFPTYAAQHLDEYRPNESWTPDQAFSAAQELGWPSMAQAYLLLVRDLLGTMVSFTVAGILLFRKSRDWFGLFLAMVFILNGPTSGTAVQPAKDFFPLYALYKSVVGATSWQFFFIMFFFFPDGRAVPRWTRWLVAFWLLVMPFTVGTGGGSTPILSTLAILFVLASLLSQIYRYVRVADPIHRQQTKWLVLVLLFGLIYIPILAIFGFRAPDPAHLGRDLVVAYGILFAFTLIFWLVPLAITIAILRYRLWDIDLIIRRTLVYAILTALMGLIYLGSVVVIQQLLGGLIKQNSPVAIVISTLTIAALFTPLRNRIQAIIDRRFFRKKYNADQAMEQLSAALRNEVDVEQVQYHLVSMVSDTIQPEQISLWINKPSA